MGSGVATAGAALSSSGKGDGSSEIDSSDDGKRKQGGELEEGAPGRSGKQMRAAGAGVGSGLRGE